MIYLDNASTTFKKPPEVLAAMCRFMRETGTSPGREGHELSRRAEEIVFQTRRMLADLFAVRQPEKIIFTLNATEALNLALRGLLRAGEHAITSSLEHNSVIRPLRFLQETGVEVTVLPCRDDGELAPQEVEKALRPSTRLIALTHASNVTGTLLPVQEVGEIAKRHDIAFLVDAAQSAGFLHPDVEKDGISLLAFSGHKGLMGPQGTGGLYVGPDLALVPLKFGGTGARSELDLQPEELPERLEAGTPNAVGIAGLGAAVGFISSKTPARIREYDREILAFFLQELRNVEGIRIYGSQDPDRMVPVVSCNLEGHDPAEVGAQLESCYGILVRTGLHCAPLAHKTIGTFPSGTVRFSFGYFTTPHEVELAIRALKEIAAG